MGMPRFQENSAQRNRIKTSFKKLRHSETKKKTSEGGQKIQINAPAKRQRHSEKEGRHPLQPVAMRFH